MNYEFVGKLKLVRYVSDGGFGSIQVSLYRCSGCFSLIDEEHREQHTLWHKNLNKNLHKIDFWTGISD